LKARAEELTEPWKPVVVAEASGFQVKVVRLHGEFPMHSHEAQDELFLCLSGEFDIELEEAESVTLKSGDVFVVPAGRRHRPVARKPATTALFEPAETRQYGD
jgi:mannose-6-phosphate isomerase-like protein (cupin superfamily)